MPNPNPAMPDFVLEQELDEIESMCSECGKIHGPEACQYEGDWPEFDSSEGV